MNKERELQDKPKPFPSIFKILHGHSNVDWNLWFTKNVAAIGGRETRSAADPHSLRMPPSRLELRRNFFSLRVVEKWNNLPSEVKSAQNVKQFKMTYMWWW